MTKNLGTQALTTEHLILRRATFEDASAMYHNWANDPEVTKYLTWPPHASIEVTKEILQSWIDSYSNDESYQWMIVPKDIMEPIGTISGLHPDKSLSTIEIGYCIGKKWWHQGITSEALQAVLHFFFEECEYQHITARHKQQNPHSGDVMKKCGMTYDHTSDSMVYYHMDK